MRAELVKHEVRFGEDIRTLDIFQVGAYTVRRLTIEGKFRMVSFSMRTDREFFPEIVYHDDLFGDAAEFRIQTCAYGAKTVAEIEQVITGYQEAVEVVKVLEKTFLGRN